MALVFLVGQVGNEKSVCFFFLVPGQSGSNLFSSSFPPLSQCSHLLSQGNAVTGTFARAVVIWTGRSTRGRGQSCPPASVAAARSHPATRGPLSAASPSPRLRQGRLLEAQECTGECRSLA